MPVTQMAVYYGTQSNILRSIVIPDDDTQLQNLVAPPGVTILIVPLAPSNDTAIRAIIAAHTKRAQLGDNDDRCCVIDGTNTVVSIIKADPVIDTLPNATLILSQVAILGDTWDGTQFNRRWVLVLTATGIVQSIVTVPVGTTPTVNAGQVAIASTTLQIGDVVHLGRPLSVSV